MKFLTLLFLLITLSFGDTVLKIASYNVENLFDLSNDTNRYEEFKANGKSLWNQRNYKIKLNNISDVIKDLDADIIALQEIGSLNALKDLRFALKQKGLYYEHFAIADKKNTVIKVALLSKIPFVYAKELEVTPTYKHRNILEVKFRVESQEFYLFVNHWKAKSGPESMRIVSAKKLKQRIEQLGDDKNIIALGDFNSDYEEHIKFKRKRKLNDTDGKTGINHVLKTIKPHDEGLYNLWYDTEEPKRYSYIYKKQKEAIDNILISQTLRDKNGASYIKGSVSNFAKEYLFRGERVYRWQMRSSKHTGKGYSDHLPVSAKFLFKK